jgi:hypothetical protein
MAAVSGAENLAGPEYVPDAGLRTLTLQQRQYAL